MLTKDALESEVVMQVFALLPIVSRLEETPACKMNPGIGWTGVSNSILIPKGVKHDTHE